MADAAGKNRSSNDNEARGFINIEAAELGRKLYDLGFNIVPVKEKKPLARWSPGKRLDPGVFEENLKKATGIAVVGGSENPWKPSAVLVILDIDDPRILDGNETLRKLVEETVCWRTGPRCPKCFSKHNLDPRIKIRISDDEDSTVAGFACGGCGHEFSVEEASRGLAAIFTADPGDAEKILKGRSWRSEKVEIRYNGYELMPPSIHPTGIRYEWIRRIDLSRCGRSVGNCGIRSLSGGELEELIRSLGLKGVEGAGKEDVEIKPHSIDPEGRWICLSISKGGGEIARLCLSREEGVGGFTAAAKLVFRDKELGKRIIGAGKIKKCFVDEGVEAEARLRQCFEWFSKALEIAVGDSSVGEKALDVLIKSFTGWGEAFEKAREAVRAVRRVGGRGGETTPKHLGEEEIEEIVDIVMKFYEPGYRNFIILYLLGILIKAGVDRETASKIVDAIASRANDEERDKRLVQVEYHYSNRIDKVGVEGLKGSTGLANTFEKILVGRGIDPQTARERALRAVKRILRFLGMGIGGKKKRVKLASIASALVRRIAGEMLVRTVVVDNTVIGIFCYEDGYYIPCEEIVEERLKRYYDMHGLANKGVTYASLRNEFMAQLEDSTKVFQDFNHELLVFKNGVIDWRGFIYGGRLEVRSPSPDPMVLHRIPWEIDIEVLRRYEKASRRDVVDALKRDLPEIVGIFRQWVGKRWVLLFEVIGYALLAGEYPLRKIIMNVGGGSNGKSTFHSMLERLVGFENTSYVSLQELADRGNRFAAAQLYGKLVNIYADLPGRGLLDTGIIKVLTGEDYITADRKFREPITFRNYAKMIFSCNELPRVYDMTYANWSRWVVIPWGRRFKPNPGFRRWLLEELLPRHAPKILAYSLLLIRHVIESGRFSYEEGADSYKEIWLRETNSVYAFIQDAVKEGVLERSRNARGDAEDIYLLYVEYCQREGREPLDKARFTLEMQRLGVQRVKVRGYYFYRGLRVLSRSWAAAEGDPGLNRYVDNG